MTTSLLILGASARAAAWSALRAGLIPSAADLFADRDLAAIARCVRVESANYPDGLFNAAMTFPPSPWVYTGALENRPDLVDRLAARRPLWGNSSAVLRRARDPRNVAAILREARLPFPEVRFDSTGLPRDGSWLRKPLASAGGRGVITFDADTRPTTRPVYYHRRIDGLSLSILFVSHVEGVFRVGITRQLVGRPGEAFAYRGTIAPWPVSAAVVRQVEGFGQALAARLDLVGLFGVDFVLDDEGVAWPVEINPRYTASVEVIELACGLALLDDHRRACVGEASRASEVRWNRVVAKEVIFAEANTVFLGVPSEAHSIDDLFRVPEVADVPDEGTAISAGEPVLTVFAEGATAEEALELLDRRRGAWRDRLEGLEVGD